MESVTPENKKTQNEHSPDRGNRKKKLGWLARRSEGLARSPESELESDSFSDESYDYTVTEYGRRSYIELASLANRFDGEGQAIIILPPRPKNSQLREARLLKSSMVTTPDGDRMMQIDGYQISHVDNGHMNFVHKIERRSFNDLLPWKVDGTQHGDQAVGFAKDTTVIEMVPHGGKPRHEQARGLAQQDGVLDIATLYMSAAHEADSSL